MASTSATGRPKNWGVTTPRSFNEPTEGESVSTNRLVEVLAQYYPHKRDDECRMQEDVLAKLARIVKDWVKELATERADEVNAKLFTFGSHYLQVDEPGNAIDTLCVGPNFVNRENDFLNTLSGNLEKMNEVAEMECAPDALIPYLSFKLDNVLIKLVYASISCFVIPEDLDISHDSVLDKIDDDISLCSLNACRVAQSILELVPNLKNFRITLRCVKHWAKERGIWSNVSGFLDESAWSILVARVCQAYPKALPSTLVIEFFDIFANWFWPNPIMLCHIKLGKLKVWDSRRYEADKAHCMCIISPAYPCRNLTSDGTETTLRVMKEHFKFGDEKCKEINENNGNWQDLFVPFKFFEKHMRYLHIDVVVASEKDLWTVKRWIEHRLRLLISQIEGKDLICDPCPVEFVSSDSCAFFIGLSSKKRLMGFEYVNIIVPLTTDLERRFGEWKKHDMLLRVDLVGNFQMESRTWGKLGLPVVGRAGLAS